MTTTPVAGPESLTSLDLNRPVDEELVLLFRTASGDADPLHVDAG